MPDKSEIQKLVEAAVGHKITEEEVSLISLFQKVATYSFLTDPQGTAYLTTRSIILPRPNSCSTTNYVDVCGIASTGNTGVCQFHLTSFMCPPTNLVFLLPINVVATPLSNKPCYATVSHQIINNGADVEIQVSMWDAAGKPAPSVAFDWRCRAVLEYLIV
jgi:hypothetical protein